MLDKDFAYLWHQGLLYHTSHLSLIASENHASVAILKTLGSYLTDKYAEGYPTKRYYSGCYYYDQVEQLAINRLCQLYGVEYANVQPHSGSQANQAVFLALLQPGDTILSLSLAHGGHLTHGSKVSMTSFMFNCVHYELDQDNNLDYKLIQEAAELHKPKLIIAGYSAYPGLIDWRSLGNIARSVGAYLLADIAHIAGLVAGGCYPSPVDDADVITSTTHKTLRGPRGGIIMAKNLSGLTKKLDKAVFPGMQGGPAMNVIGAKAIAFYEALQPEFKLYARQVVENNLAMVETFQTRGLPLVHKEHANHLHVLNVGAIGKSGQEVQELLEQAKILTNKNAIPRDTRPVKETSGVRIGTAAITTRGFNSLDCRQLANLISDLILGVLTPEAVTLEIEHLSFKYPINTDDKLD